MVIFGHDIIFPVQGLLIVDGVTGEGGIVSKIFRCPCCAVQGNETFTLVFGENLCFHFEIIFSSSDILSVCRASTCGVLNFSLFHFFLCFRFDYLHTYQEIISVLKLCECVCIFLSTPDENSKLKEQYIVSLAPTSFVLFISLLRVILSVVVFIANAQASSFTLSLLSIFIFLLVTTLCNVPRVF